jgi:uncharacterized protein (TIGR02266 family)
MHYDLPVYPVDHAHFVCENFSKRELMVDSRISGFRECARKARDLLQPLMEAAADAPVHEELEQAWGRLLTIDKALQPGEHEIRSMLASAFDSLEKATRLVNGSHASDWPESWHSRLAQARSLVFASGGSPRSVPPPRRTSGTMRAVVPPRKESSPSLELGELDLSALKDFDPDLLALLGPDPNSEPDSWSMLEVEVGFVGDNNFFAGLSMDVSEGGVFVATYDPKPVGATLMLSFVLPDGHTVTTPGTVKFLMDANGDMPPGMGVSFSDLSARDLDAIRRFCKTRRPTYYETD